MIRLDEGMQIKEIVVEEDHYLVTVARPGTWDWSTWIYEYEIENHKVY
jgi:galactose-1-phosphate uridylyltransferase